MMKKRILMPLAALVLATACEPIPDPNAPPVRVGLPPEQASALVFEIVSEAGCSITFKDFQGELDVRGYSAALADPTTPEGQLTLANRFILESAILDMAKADLLERSSWTFTSNTGACA